MGTVFSTAPLGIPNLTSVGYTLINQDGSVAAARSSTGVAEIAAPSSSVPKPGIYIAAISAPLGFAGAVLWDSGQGSGSTFSLDSAWIPQVTIDPNGAMPFNTTSGTQGYGFAAILALSAALTISANTMTMTLPGTTHTVAFGFDDIDLPTLRTLTVTA